MATTLLKSTTKTVAKVGIVVGATAGTVSQGVWSVDNRNGLKAYGKVMNNVLDDANKYVAQVPAVSDVSEGFKTSWNRGIQTIFSGISSVPEKTGKFITDLLSNLK